MKHILLTKFAMRFAEDNPRRRYEREGWVDYRLKLFKQYCAPSVQAQTNKDFDWWIVLDKTFPGLTKTHIKELEGYARILDIQAPWNEQQPEIGEALSSTYKDEWVCSTRLDSDDMLQHWFFETLRWNTMQEKEMWVSFKYGYMVQGNYAARRTYEVNPFLSFVEFANPFRSVFNVSHIAANRSKVPFKVVSAVGWAQVDHGDNIKNHIKAKIPDFENQKIPVGELRKLGFHAHPEF